jgi:hypothetical protein
MQAGRAKKDWNCVSMKGVPIYNMPVTSSSYVVRLFGVFSVFLFCQDLVARSRDCDADNKPKGVLISFNILKEIYAMMEPEHVIAAPLLSADD